jgi:hypothetical protein
MMSIRLIVEIDQQLLSDLMWKLHDSVKSSSLTSVFHQIESWKAQKTLRSAEKAPTLSAGTKLTDLAPWVPVEGIRSRKGTSFESHPARSLHCSGDHSPLRRDLMNRLTTMGTRGGYSIPQGDFVRIPPSPLVKTISN